MRILPVRERFFTTSHTKYTDNNRYENNNYNLNTDFRPVSVTFMSSVKQKPFELGYSLDELKRMTAPEKFTPFVMLEENAEVYKNLAESDKEALTHLVKVAEIFHDVQKRLDNIHNKEFENYLNRQIEKSDERARLTKILYDGQKGIFGANVAGDKIALAKNLVFPAGRGFYPEDLSEKEFHEILLRMLKNGEIDEVKNILNQRTVVVRNRDKLKGIDYTEFFKNEFTKAAEELELASQKSSNDDFNEFLKYQAMALRENNPLLDSIADKKWAELQNTPLEFTIGRECYDDRMTLTVFSNPELKSQIEKYKIPVYSKDSLGVRVGIIDKAGTDYLLKIKEYLPYMAENMPYNNEYNQVINKDIKQSMVDANIVDVSGIFAAYKGKISIASNLPNEDKLAVQTGGGFRNVYHKQTRNAKYAYGAEDRLNALLEKHLHKYFNVDALHDFTILHENIHSLGPKGGTETLGVYKNIIEEHKADMGAFVMMKKLAEKGFYTPQRAKEAITSEIFAYILKGPFMSDAHARRQIMQFNYFINNGAIKVSDEGKIDIDFEKIYKCANEMLKKAVRIQISKSYEDAEKYVKQYSTWTKELDILAKKLRSVDVRENSYIVTPLAQKILAKSKI